MSLPRLGNLIMQLRSTVGTRKKAASLWTLAHGVTGVSHSVTVTTQLMTRLMVASDIATTREKLPSSRMKLPAELTERGQPSESARNVVKRLFTP